MRTLIAAIIATIASATVMNDVDFAFIRFVAEHNK